MTESRQTTRRAEARDYFAGTAMQPQKTNQPERAQKTDAAQSSPALQRVTGAKRDDAIEPAAASDGLKPGTTLGFTPFDPSAEVHDHRLRLPHWRQWGRTYFVTARLADSVPSGVAADWRRRRDAWLRGHGLSSSAELDRLTEAQRHEYHREFTAKYHTLLDAGHGECVLAQARCADILAARLDAGDGTAYELDAWCVMPNHLHALVHPAEKVTLGEIVRHWKGGSAYEINRALSRSGKLWQPEAFDHIVRSEPQLEHFRRYIAENPAKARLKSGYVVRRGKVVMGFSP